MCFSGKVVLITGSSSGIGACTAFEFAKQNANLSLTGRNEDNLKSVAKKCIHLGAQDVIYTVADLTIEEDIKNLVTNTVQGFKSKTINVLVNSAGIYETDCLLNASEEKFDRIFQTNLKSIYSLTHLAVPFLIQSKGNIVNVSSYSGIRSVPWSLSYSMSKASLDQFTKCTALELASKGVRVNSVNPGATLTGIQKKSGIMTQEKMDEFVERCRKTHPLGRPGYPEDIANAILFLASEKSSFITGVVLPIDGGKHISIPQ